MATIYTVKAIMAAAGERFKFENKEDINRVITLMKFAVRSYTDGRQLKQGKNRERDDPAITPSFSNSNIQTGEAIEAGEAARATTLQGHSFQGEVKMAPTDEVPRPPFFCLNSTFFRQFAAV